MSLGRESRLLFACCLAGAGTMAVELSAVRLIAPWFGTSQAVWTSAIGAVLIALTLGYLIGGRWASAPHPERRMISALWAASAWGLCLPVLAPWVADALVPAGSSLEQVAAGLPVASLACALVLFLPPATLLATAGPLVVELLSRGGEASAGRAGGRVLAYSTLGSLIGTFGTTYLGIPYLGLTETLWCTSALLALGALLCSGTLRHHQAAALLLGGALVASSTAPAAAPAGLLAEVESPYQRVRVVQRADGWRALEVNERMGSFQSVWRPELGLLGGGHYYDLFALPPAWSGAREEWRVLVLGLGAGTTWRVLEGTLPEGCALNAAGVELDPLVTSLAQEYMELPVSSEDRRVLSDWDARAALGPLGREGREWDQVVVDVYANQVEIPPHLATLEFFLEARELLAPGGWLQVNVGAGDHADPLALAIGSTLAAAFEAPTLALEVPFSRNVVMVQRREEPVPSPNSPEFIPSVAGLRELAQQIRIPGAWALIEGGQGRLLRDDDAPLEALQRASLRRMADL